MLTGVVIIVAFFGALFLCGVYTVTKSLMDDEC